MEFRRRVQGNPLSRPQSAATEAGNYHQIHHKHRSDQTHNQSHKSAPARASKALPLPLYLTSGIFFTLFFCIAYFLLIRWREKIRDSIPLHVVSVYELVAVLTVIASVIYLLCFFGIDFVQSHLSHSSDTPAKGFRLWIRDE